MSSLARLGLGEAKISETEKNGALTTTLKTMIDSADKRAVNIDKNLGTLLYNLGSKLKKPDHLPTILDLILEKKVRLYY